MIKKILFKILKWVVNRRSVIIFSTNVNGNPNIVFKKKRLRHIPAVNTLIYFDNPNIRYNVVGVVHNITYGHKIFIGLELVTEKEMEKQEID